jgi:hypothetical protein
MNQEEFLNEYLWPSNDRLDRSFTHTLPNIDGLKKYGDFIIQSECEDTFSTNIISEYKSDTLGVILKDVYKNTQNKVTLFFIRLVGTMSIVKTGYPFLLLDTSVRNVSLLTGEREDIMTRVYITLPQADLEQRDIFFNHLNAQAQEASLSYSERKSDAAPDSWGPTGIGESKGVDLDMIRCLRDYSWGSYKRVIDKTKEKIPFDYKPIKENAIFNVAGREHSLFRKIGLSVPIEAQAAFFSVLFSVA